MTHSFSFGFGSDDIEENVNETVELRPSHDTREDKPVAVMEPKLHKLQDLVGMKYYSSVFPPFFFGQACCSFLFGPRMVSTMALMYYCASGCATAFPIHSPGRAYIQTINTLNFGGIVPHTYNIHNLSSMFYSQFPS